MEYWVVRSATCCTCARQQTWSSLAFSHHTIVYAATRCTYSLRSYMLWHVRASANASLLNGSRTPVLHSGMTPVWPLDMVYTALHAVRTTHLCECQRSTERQPHTSLAFRYDTSLPVARGYGLRSSTCCTYAQQQTSGWSRLAFRYHRLVIRSCMLYVRTSVSASASGVQLPVPAAHQSCILKLMS